MPVNERYYTEFQTVSLMKEEWL